MDGGLLVEAIPISAGHGLHRGMQEFITAPRTAIDPITLCDRSDHAILHDMAAMALPVDVTDHALGREVPIGYIGKRTKMDVGDMGEPEHHAFLGYAEAAFHPHVAAGTSL